jgi:glucose-1-phosphate thymidylyltransferase
MQANISDILLISTLEEVQRFRDLLGDGSDFGISISYKVQPSPDGLAQAFILGEEFIGKDSVALVLGDNLFYGHDLIKSLESASKKESGGTVFGYHVSNPSAYGVVEFNNEKKVISIEEKPKAPKSNYAIPGLYFFDNQVIDIAKNVKPSKRGELEITDVIQAYLDEGKLSVEIMGRGTAWLDTGTHDDLLAAGAFIETIEKRQGLKINCPEEIAFRNGWLSKEQLAALAQPLKKSGYGEYLLKLIDEKIY